MKARIGVRVECLTPEFNRLRLKFYHLDLFEIGIYSLVLALLYPPIFDIARWEQTAPVSAI
jgi:hypothetical protein